jgi:hypothetical protein
MIMGKHSSELLTLRLVGTVLRVWAVGFMLAASGTMWLARKTLRFLPFRRAAPKDENLID